MLHTALEMWAAAPKAAGWLIGAIPDPAPAAPAGLKTDVNKVLGLIKWVSLMCALAVLLGSGAMVFASEHGHGSGLSPKMKSTVGSVILVLIIVGSASAVVTFLS